MRTASFFNILLTELIHDLPTWKNSVLFPHSPKDGVVFVFWNGNWDMGKDLHSWIRCKLL